MGKGDKKSKRGKIIIGSFGVRRRKKDRKSVVASLPKGPAKSEINVDSEVPPEVRTTKQVKTVRPKTAARPAVKPAAKKSIKEEGEDSGKAAKPVSKAKKAAAGKEE